MTFTEPPFWASRRWGGVAPHAVSVLVQPVVVIVSASIAAASVITTLTPHHYVSGDTALLAGVTGSTPAVDGTRVVTVLTPTSFSIPVLVTVAGAGGTVTRTIPVEPLTLVEGKLRAGLDWVGGDPRDGLMTGFIAAARSKVEQDTGLALLLQTRDVFFDALPRQGPIVLPAQSRPLQAVTSIASIDTSDSVNTLDAANYVVDLASGRIGLSLLSVWPTDLRPFQPWAIRIVSGWPSVAALQAAAPLLVHAVGLLTAHYATLGRDLASLDPATEVPQGYADVISSYVPVVVA